MFAVGSSIFNKEFVEAVVVANPNMAANPAIQAEMIREEQVDIHGILWMIYTRSGQRFVCYTRQETFQNVSQSLLAKVEPSPPLPTSTTVSQPSPLIDPNFTSFSEYQVVQPVPITHSMPVATTSVPINYSIPITTQSVISKPTIEPPKIIKQVIPPAKTIRMADANMNNESNRGQLVNFDDEEFSMEDIKKMTKKKR